MRTTDTQLAAWQDARAEIRHQARLATTFSSACLLGAVVVCGVLIGLGGADVSDGQAASAVLSGAVLMLVLAATGLAVVVGCDRRINRQLTRASALAEQLDLPVTGAPAQPGITMTLWIIHIIIGLLSLLILCGAAASLIR
ncbi:hypothetical protein Cs7R123_60470 [Catellatospora sp. TT07R-123]|uniref:hypothetical protein n=1 Tax=Catellatospora sp. TT07R-123 TaxID=2733863 RepID=UPI001B0A853D|nr:hypothetical protein [Catellatospora sp. TT07R-123]GHJ48705.1 hypothetical protein Cs7R123_60470 [Catellatospora sp. TT07R-123]